MKVYTLTNVWSYNGFGVLGTCLGVYPTEEQAQKAMTKNVLATKEDWEKDYRVGGKKGFLVREQPRAVSFTSLTNSDCDIFIIEENEMKMPSETAQENK